MNDLEIRLLGDLVVKAGGEAVTTLNKPRLQSLLTYLILHRDAPQFRYHLAGILWPDSPEAQAHTNLRNLVYLLRKALPGGDHLIFTANQTLQWNPEAAIKLDVADFYQIVSKAPPQNLPLEDLETAVQYYQGDLLPSCYDEWISAERGHYRQVFITILDELIDRYEALRRYADAIAYCQRLVQLEPFHKNGYPRLMRLLAVNGEAPAALKAYRDYEHLLKRELGIEPPAEMIDLCAGIQRAVKPSAGGYQASTPAPLPLVGRAEEWRAIQSLWKTTAGGRSRLLLICGEAGIGKTRLAEELLDWAARQGIRIAAAHCYASEGALPYAPVVAWLRALRLPPLDRVWQVELSRLLPELHKNSAAPLAPLSEAWQRLRLFEALARAILGNRQKSLLLIEDLQWCDQDTLEWLHYLLRFDPGVPLLVVGTARSEETAANPAYVRLLSGLQQEGSHLEIELKPLNEMETGQLAAHVAGKKLEQTIGSLLYRETEGNPLFIVEMVRTEVFRQARLPGVQPLPYKAHAVLENRIRQLSAPSRAAVLLAATIGRAFTLDVLRQASGAGEAELINNLDELLHRRIVREVAQNTFDFSHDKLREAAFVGISRAHRQLLHRQVADALVRLASNHLDSLSSEIASHYEQAGSVKEAVQYYQAAAEAARNIYANDLAILYYQRAVSLCETTIPDSPTQVFSPDQQALLYEKLGEMWSLVGKYPQAQAAFERALAQPGSSQRIWRSQIYRKISQALISQYQHAQVFTALDQAEQTLGISEKDETLAARQEWLQIQLARSDAFYWDNQPDQMDVILQKILPILEAYGRHDQKIELLSQQFLARCKHERYRLSEATVEISRRKLELVSGLGVPYDIAWAQFHVGFCLLWHGEPLAARNWLDKAYDAAVRIGARLIQVRSLTYQSIASRQLGDQKSLREQSILLFEMASAIGEFTYQGISQANQGWLAWKDGDYTSAVTLCNAANEVWNHYGRNVFHCLSEWVLLAIAVTAGDLGSTVKHAQALLDPNPLYQPLLAPVAAHLDAGLQACQAGNDAAAFLSVQQALEIAKASGDL